MNEVTSARLLGWTAVELEKRVGQHTARPLNDAGGMCPSPAHAALPAAVKDPFTCAGPVGSPPTTAPHHATHREPVDRSQADRATLTLIGLGAYMQQLASETELNDERLLRLYQGVAGKCAKAEGALTTALASAI